MHLDYLLEKPRHAKSFEFSVMHLDDQTRKFKVIQGAMIRN